MKKDVKESATEIRKVLKTTYPGIKFSVRAKRFAGGSWVNITWTDGPTGKEIRDTTAHLKEYENGFYNEYIDTIRHISREVMGMAAKAAAEYYKVETPEVVGDVCPYVEGQIADEIHRAVWSTSVYNIDAGEAFSKAFPN